MKAITICQPYAHLICLPETDPRHKRVENRTWSTSYRGPLAIHAGKSRDWLTDEYEIPESQMVFGAVVAIADLVLCVAFSALRSHAQRFPWLPTHSHANGPFCWVLSNVRVLPRPVPYKGAQGLWDLPDGIGCER